MDKEVRFTEKKVDDSWKLDVAREKGQPEQPKPESAPPRPGLTFTQFITSLGYQALMHLGELPYPGSKEKRVDLEGAKETIDILVLLDSKTQGNQTPEEQQLFKTLLSELQMKFVAKASGH